MISGTSLLLDTCAVIWLANGGAMATAALARIADAAAADAVLVSPVSAWEIGLLSRPSQARPVHFAPDPQRWFARFLGGPGVRLAALTPAMAIGSSLLPGGLHGDPADRLLVATARELGVPIVTRDARLLEYAAAGHVAALAC